MDGGSTRKRRSLCGLSRTVDARLTSWGRGTTAQCGCASVGPGAEALVPRALRRQWLRSPAPCRRRCQTLVLRRRPWQAPPPGREASLCVHLWMVSRVPTLPRVGVSLVGAGRDAQPLGGRAGDRSLSDISFLYFDCPCVSPPCSACFASRLVWLRGGMVYIVTRLVASHDLSRQLSRPMA